MSPTNVFHYLLLHWILANESSKSVLALSNTKLNRKRFKKERFSYIPNRFLSKSQFIFKPCVFAKFFRCLRLSFPTSSFFNWIFNFIKASLHVDANTIENKNFPIEFCELLIDFMIAGFLLIVGGIFLAALILKLIELAIHTSTCCLMYELIGLLKSSLIR